MRPPLEFPRRPKAILAITKRSASVVPRRHAAVSKSWTHCKREENDKYEFESPVRNAPGK